ncbi:MAG: hypothetical protein CMJ25_01685 [Phycisphaerae bacterium]|nr:hypothetical protein [Phycisphaerae bacterium]|tara:strand:+ start:1303 stop:1800 length:498 start_codon:yes stop_codon:yes gene_type:complete
MFCSHYRYTFNGVVLLDFGDKMLEEPAHPIAKQVQESNFVGARWGKARDRGNAIRTFNWSRVMTFASLAERQTWQLQLAASYMGLATGDLLIEVENGGSTRIKDFCLNSVTPSQRWEKNQYDLVLAFEGLGGKEETVTFGGYADAWLATDASTWDTNDSTKWQLI